MNSYINNNCKIFNENNINVIQNINKHCTKYIFVTDPPYNIKYQYNTYTDNLQTEEYYKMLWSIFKDNMHIIIHYPESIYEYAVRFQIVPKKVISWVYNTNTEKQHREIAFFGVNPDLSKATQEYKNPNDKRIAKRIAEGQKCKLYDWWHINQVKNISKEKTEHPCQIPVEVMQNIIQILPEDCTIVDPFMGSGTTAIACINLNRAFIGIEIDEKYFDISKKRIINHIGIFNTH